MSTTEGDTRPAITQDAFREASENMDDYFSDLLGLHTALDLITFSHPTLQSKGEQNHAIHSLIKALGDKIKKMDASHQASWDAIMRPALSAKDQEARAGEHDGLHL